MNEMVSTRKGFGDGLLELSEKRDDVLVTSADTYRSFALADFVKRFPERYFEFGIAEQCMVTASGAMAGEGYCVFTVGYSPFLSMRALEQIRTFVCYPNQNVKIIAGLGGLSGDTDGVTHQGTEDIGIIRSLPNMTLVCPADAVAAKRFVREIAEINTPVYLRLGRGATPVIYPESQSFEVGRAIRLCGYGNDLAIIAAGPCVAEAKKSADLLKEQGIKVRVLDMHTIKPLDESAVLAAAGECGRILTVEDGSVYGGLGGAVAEALTENGCRVKGFKRLGLTTFGTAGTLPDLLGFFKIDARGIAEAAKELLKQ